jgi:hypothetical protein
MIHVGQKQCGRELDDRFVGANHLAERLARAIRDSTTILSFSAMTRKFTPLENYAIEFVDSRVAIGVKREKFLMVCWKYDRRNGVWRAQ